MVLDICIPTWNRGHVLREKLEKLMTIAESHPVNVLIFDNASNDSTEQVLAEYERYEWCNVYRHSVNVGFDKNIESLILNARSDYVWLHGDDDIICTEQVPLLLEQLERRPNAVWANISNGLMSTSEYMQATQVQDSTFEKLVAKYGFFGFFGGLAHTICRRELLQNAVDNNFVGTNYYHLFAQARALSGSNVLMIQEPLTHVSLRSDEETTGYIERWGMTAGGPWDESVLRQGMQLLSWLVKSKQPSELLPGCFGMYVGMQFPFQWILLSSFVNLRNKDSRLSEPYVDTVRKLMQMLPIQGYVQLFDELIDFKDHEHRRAFFENWWRRFRALEKCDWRM